MASLSGLSGCGAFGPDPRDAALAFVDAVASGDTETAANLTDDPAAAGKLIRQVRDALEPQQVAITLDQLDSGQSDTGERTVTASYTAVWDFGEDRRWRYSNRFELTPADTEAGWLVRWSPEVLHPQIGAQQRVVRTAVPPAPAPVVDRSDNPLLTPQTVVTVGLDRAQAGNLRSVAATLAAALAPFDSRITTQSIMDGAAAAPEGQPSVVAVLREPDFLSVQDEIAELPGVSVRSGQRLLGPDRDFASQLVPGLRGTVEDQLAEAAGWRIITVDALGAEVDELAGEPPRVVPTLPTTVDLDVQTAAEGAVEGVPSPAMMVAIQASTGDILAVAQNAAADAQGSLSLTGQYPPGSTFKIVTAAEALRSGGMAPDTPVPCPATTVIGGRLIPNIDRFELGTVPLQTAFARSCNTTFAQLAADFEPQQLPEAAARMGIGMDYDIPGVTTLTGAVEPSDSPVQRAEDGFGQGRVLVTPFGMALVAATVAADGQIPTPSLIRGAPTETEGEPPAALSGEVADGLAGMMRAVVTDGTATALSVHGDVHGKTGTAERASDGSHGWFVGYRGDLAFATLVVDAGSSGPATEVSGRFLGALDGLELV